MTLVIDPDLGKKVAELHKRHRECSNNYLTDSECLELTKWLKIIYDYNHGMGHHINAVYFGNEYETFDKICDARGIQ